MVVPTTTSELTRRLERESDARLQRLAQYSRPTWRTRTVCALELKDDEDEENEEDEVDEEEGVEEAGEEKGESDGEGDLSGGGVLDHERGRRKKRPRAVLAQQQLEVLDGASLADVRKLISTFCAGKIPPRFVFAAIHQRRERGFEDDERDVCVDDALDRDGTLTVLVPPAPKSWQRGNTSNAKRSVKSVSPRTQGGAARAPPSFSVPRLLFGDVMATIDVYARRTEGVTLELSAFADRGGALIQHLTMSELTIQLSVKILADRVGMSEGMVAILLSTPGGQKKSIKKLLRRLHLSVVASGENEDECELRWQWTAKNAVDEKDLHIARRVRVTPQLQASIESESTIGSGQGMLLSAAFDADSSAHDTSAARLDHPMESTIKPLFPYLPMNEHSASTTAPVAAVDGETIAPPHAQKKSTYVQHHEATRQASSAPSQERKRPDQPPGSATQKTSVDVNAARIRSCLEIGATKLGEDIPSCFTLQMIFVELMLREFACSSLPVFVSELRPAIKELYRSSSQISTPENVIRGVDQLWAGVSVAFWESKMDQIATHFHNVCMRAVEDVRSKLHLSIFDAFKPPSTGIVPSRVDAVLRALLLLSGEAQVEEKSVEAVLHDLYLDVPSTKKRLKVFALVQDKKRGRTRLSLTSRKLLSRYVVAANLANPMPPELESIFNISVLRNALVAILNIIDFDIRTYARRTNLLSGEDVKALQENIYAVVKKSDRQAQNFGVESSKKAESIVAATSRWAENVGLDAENLKRLSFLLQLHSADPARWYKALKDCEVFSSCPRPSRLRWYIEPMSQWCDLHDERYMFVAESDLAFEFIFMDFSVEPSEKSTADESTMAYRALSAWFGSAVASPNAEVSPTFRDAHTKVAFGVNYRYAGHPILSITKTPSLKQILESQHVDSVVIGCSCAESEGPRTVILRCFVQEGFVQQHAWSVSSCLLRIQVSGDMQARIVSHGALPFVRLLVLRDQHKGAPIVTLVNCARYGQTDPQKALDSLLRSAGKMPLLVHAHSVAHLVFSLLLRRQLDLEYGCTFLESMREFVEESSAEVVGQVMSQRFERIPVEFSDRFFPGGDIYDVLWVLASRHAGLPYEWSALAEDIAVRVFFLQEIRSDYRVFRYSRGIGNSGLVLQELDDHRLVVSDPIAFEALDLDRVRYYQQLLHVVKAARAISSSPERSSKMSSGCLHLEEAVMQTSHQDQKTIVECLVLRCFAAMHTEHGLRFLGITPEFIETIEDAFEDAKNPSLLATVAADLVAYIASICESNTLLQQSIFDLRLVDRLVEVAWKVDCSVISVRLIQALSTFQKFDLFRRQIVYAIPRLTQPTLPHPGFTLMRDIIPTGTILQTTDDEYLKRVQRLNVQICEQHLSSRHCRCSANPSGVALDSLELHQKHLKTTVKKFVKTSAARALRNYSLFVRRIDGSARATSVEIMVRKATKIQRRVLRWLYISRRPHKRILCSASAVATCHVCKTTPSFLLGVLLFFDSIDTSSRDSRIDVELDISQALQCFQIFVRDPNMCNRLVSEFCLERALLGLTSHGSHNIRSLALDALTELSWRSKVAFTFTSSRLSKAIWENYAAALQRDDYTSCSWVQHALNFAVGKTRPDATLISRLASEERVHRSVWILSDSRTAHNGGAHPDVDSTASMLLLLSFDIENSELFLKVVRMVTANLTMWIRDAKPYGHIKILLTIQNALVRAPSLRSMVELAVKTVEDFKQVLNTTDLDDGIAKAAAFGVIWTFSTCARIRKHIASSLPDVMAPIERMVTKRSLISSAPSLVMLLNAIGLLATMSVDCQAKGMSCQAIGILQQLYMAINDAISKSAPTSTGLLPATRLPSESDFNKRGAVTSDEAALTSEMSLLSSTKSEWALQLAQFNLLPEMGVFTNLSRWDLLAQRVLDQIFRCLSIAAACRTYDESITRKCLTYYVENFPIQVHRGGPSADYALKTLPQVYRLSNSGTGQSTDLSAKKAMMGEKDVATIVEVLGYEINRLVNKLTDMEPAVDVAELKTLRRVIVSLWGLQVSSHKAQSLSRSMTDTLVKLLGFAEAGDDLRIAILGLLVKMYRVQTHVDSSEAASSAIVSDETKATVLRVIMKEVPTIVDLLLPYAQSPTSGKKMVQSIQIWSPLMLDKYDDVLQSSPSERDRQEVVSAVRWPVEVLNLLCESIFLEKVSIFEHYHDVLLELLVQLDCASKRTTGIQGRDETVLGIASILRATCRRIPLTSEQADLCMQALFDSDSMMTYASDLAAICHAAIQASSSIDLLIQRPDRNVLVASLRFIKSGELRPELLSNCLDMMSTVAAAMGEKLFMEQVQLYENTSGCAITALFGQMVMLFQNTITKVEEWTISRKGLKLFHQLLEWPSFFGQFILAKKMDRHASTRAPTHATDFSVSVRLRRNHLDETTRAVLKMALVLVPYKYWLDYVPWAFHTEVLSASVEANGIITKLLHAFREGTQEAATVLELAGQAYIGNNQHRVVTDTSKLDPIGALISVLTKTYFNAKDSIRDPFLSQQSCERIRLATLDCLVSLTKVERACHALPMADFFVDNYRNPVFQDASAAAVTKLLRLYRQCCCNAFVYRIIRLGKTTLWDIPEEDDESTFFEKLGMELGCAQLRNQLEDSEFNQFELDLALFLEQQDFSFVGVALAGDLGGATVADGQDVFTKKADEMASQQCLRVHFAQSPAATTFSASARQFENGIINSRKTGEFVSVPGLVLVDQLVRITASQIETSPRAIRNLQSQRSTYAIQHNITLLGILARVVSSIEDASVGGQQQAISDFSWEHLLSIIENNVLDQAELQSIFDLLHPGTRYSELAHRTSGTFNAVAARLGWEGISTFGPESCRMTMSFLHTWMPCLHDEAMSLLLGSPRWFNRLFEAMTFDDLVEDALSCLSEVIHAASTAHRRLLVLVMAEWHPSDMTAILKTPKATAEIMSDTVWRSILKYMSECCAAGRIEAVEASLALLSQLVSANPEVVTERLVSHNVISFACHLLFSASRVVVKSALRLLVDMTSCSLIAGNAFSGMLRAGTTQLYYDGPMQPIRAKQWDNPTELGPDAIHLQRDQAKIVDLLTRQPICSGLAANEILLLSTLVSTARFSIGEYVSSTSTGPTGLPSVLILASGTVEWKFEITRPDGRTQYTEVAGLGKGAAVNASGLLVVRTPSRHSLNETAIAVSDVVCLVLGEQLWGTPLGHKICDAIPHATGSWHRWVVPIIEARGSGSTTESFMRRVIDLASGNMGGDKEVQDGAALLVGLTCRSMSTRQQEHCELEWRDAWIVCMVMPTILGGETPLAMRRDVISLLARLASLRPPFEIDKRGVVVSFGRDRDRLDGVVILARAFQVCAASPQCFGPWLQAVKHHVFAQAPYAVDDRRVRTFVRSMTDAAILRLAATCIHLASDTSSIHEDVWSVLLVVTHITHRLSRLMKALSEDERISLATKILRMPQRSEEVKSSQLALLAKLTTVASFSVSLWSLTWSNGDPSLQSVFTLDHARYETVRDDVLNILDFASNTLACPAIPVEAKQELVLWLHQSLRGAVQRLAMSAEHEIPVELHFIPRVCAFICALKHHALSTGHAATSNLLRDFHQREWRRLIHRSFSSAGNARLLSRSQNAKVLSALRIIYGANQLALEDAAEVGDVVAALFTTDDEDDRWKSTQRQRDCVVVSMLRNHAGNATVARSLPMNLHSATHFVRANSSIISASLSDPALRCTIVRRLQIFREGCSVWASNSADEDDTDQLIPSGRETEASGSRGTIRWIVGFISTHESNAAIRRAAACSLSRLLDEDDRVRRTVSATALKAVLPQLFNSLAYSIHALASITRLLCQVCFLVTTTPADFPGDRDAPSWAEIVMRLALHCKHDDETMQTLVSILRWLFSTFRTIGWSSAGLSTMAAQFIQRTLIRVSAVTLDSSASGRSLEIANDGMLIATQVFSLHIVQSCDFGVLREFVEALLEWIAAVSANPVVSTVAIGGCNADGFFFDCLSAIDRLAADDEYVEEVSLALWRSPYPVLPSCRSVLASLDSLDVARRCLVLNVVRLTIRATGSTMKRETQLFLRSVASYEAGWLASLSSQDAWEREGATVLVQLMCNGNEDILQQVVRPEEPLTQMLEGNLRHCFSALQPVDGQAVGALHAVPIITSTVTRTSAILRELVRACAGKKQPLSKSLLDVVVLLLGVLQICRVTGDSEIGTSMPPTSGAVCAVVQLLKTCIKYHMGTCRSHLACRRDDLLVTLVRSLEYLLPYPVVVTRCASIFGWVSRLARRRYRPQGTISHDHSVNASTVGVLGALLAGVQSHSGIFPYSRTSVRLVEAIHVLTSEVIELIGLPVDELSPTLSLDALLGLYPNFVTEMECRAFRDCISLALQTAVGGNATSRLESHVLKTVQDTHKQFARGVDDKSMVASAVRLHARLIIMSFTVMELVDARSARDGDTCTQVGEALPRAALTCLDVCIARDLSSPAGALAISLARFTTRRGGSASCIFTDLSQVSGAVFGRVLSLIERQPLWQLAWLLTSILRSNPRGNLDLWGGYRTRFIDLLPYVTMAATTRLSENHVQACFQLLGLVTEIIRDAFGSDRPLSAGVLPVGQELDGLLLRCLRVRSNDTELPSLALVCRHLMRRVEERYPEEPVAVVSRGADGESEMLALISEAKARPALRDESTKRFVEYTASFIGDRVRFLCQSTPEKDLAVGGGSPKLCLDELIGGEGDQLRGESPGLAMHTPAITLLDHPSERGRLLGAWMALKVIEELLQDGGHESIGRLFIDTTTVISDAASLLNVADALPNALVAVALRVLARSLAAFRLFDTPVAMSVDIASVSRLVWSNELSIALAAMRTLWQLLRNQSRRHQFVAAARLQRQDVGENSADMGKILRGLQHAKEVVYTGELNDRRLEAAFGILVQLAKVEGAFDLVVHMDEFHPNAIFLDDPHSLLSAFTAAPSPLVHLQQCKLLKHLAKCRPHAVLEKPNALKCLGDGLIAATSGAPGPWSVKSFLVVGEALLSLVTAASELTKTSVESLHVLFADQECAVLRACHRALRSVVDALWSEVFLGETTAEYRALALFAELFFSLTSTKRAVCLSTEVVDVIIELPRTSLLALCSLRGDSHKNTDDDEQNDRRYDHVDTKQLRYRLLRTLRRITVAPSVANHFRADSMEQLDPFDLLERQLGHSSFTSLRGRKHVDPHVRELFLVVLHLSRDPIVSENMAKRHVDDDTGDPGGGVLNSMLQYHKVVAPDDILVLMWQVFRNVVTHAPHVSDLAALLAHREHVNVLVGRMGWAERNGHQVALALTATLRAIAEKTASAQLPLESELADHSRVLQFCPALEAIVQQMPWALRLPAAATHPARASAILEHIAHTLTLTMRACSKDFAVLSSVLVVIEHLIRDCKFEADARQDDPHSTQSAFVWTSRLREAIERLVCSLCDLLLSFHEDETNNTLFPGYNIKPIRFDREEEEPTGVSVASDGVKRLPTRANVAEEDETLSAPKKKTRVRLHVSGKKTGVYSKGESPTSPEALERIVRIFSCACSFHSSPHHAERVRKRAGRSGATSTAVACGNCIIYVCDFLLHAAQTASGRFVFLNPHMIQMWHRLLPRMDKYSIHKVCDGLLLCALSKDHTLSFLSSGALQLFVAATCKIVRDAAAKGHQSGLEPTTRTRRAAVTVGTMTVIHDAFLQFIVTAGVLSDRGPFLQSTFYLVHAGAAESITIAGLVIAAIIHSRGCSSSLKLACKVLCRFLMLFTQEESQTFLASCPGQMARSLGWESVSDDDVLMALLTMVEQTEGEALMKHRVLVKIVHGSLIRTAVLGLIDKGLPESLHDNELKPMMEQMEAVLAACHDVQDASRMINSGSTLQSADPQNAGPHRRNSLSAPKAAVVKLAAGLSAVEAAISVGVTFLGAPLQAGDSGDNHQQQYHRGYLNGRLERCTNAFKSVASKIAEYTTNGYRTVFTTFENRNEELELIAAMQTSSHAIAFTQATFYGMEVLQEAIVAALLEDEEYGRDSGKEVDERSLRTTAVVSETQKFLRKLEDVFESINVSLQHNDMDVLFYGHKLQQFGRLVNTLFQLPIADEEHETGVFEATALDGVGLYDGEINAPHGGRPHRYHRLHHRKSHSAGLRRNCTTENYPVFLRFRSLELRSWFWSVMGFLPYLRVRCEDDVQLVRFSKANTTEEKPNSFRLRGSADEYQSNFDVQGPTRDHVATSYRELPRTVDVEVWIYLPIWYRDVLVSHAKVPLLARSMESETFDFQFYPEGSQGIHAYRPEVVSTLTMELSNRPSEPADGGQAPSIDNAFPAYSTLGSRFVRQLLRALARVTRFTKLVDAASAANRRHHALTRARLKDLNDSLEKDRRVEHMKVPEVVTYQLTKILGVLREVTHPDKLVAPSAASECEPLMVQLESMAPAFALTLTRAFETKNKRIWSDLVEAFDVIHGLFMDKGLAFFSAQFHQHTQRSHEEAKALLTGEASVNPVDPTVKRKSKREKLSSSFLGGMGLDTRAVKKTFRDIASQLRLVHLRHKVVDVQRTITGRSQATSSGRMRAWTGMTFALSKHRLQAMSKRHSSHSLVNSERELMMPQSTSAFLHQYAASKSEWRMVYPHVSLWNLSQAREPQWHSFDRMVASTSLNHFLLQPIERLQVYCVVLQILEAKLAKVEEHAEAQPNGSNDGPTSEVVASRVQSSSSDVEQISDGRPSPVPSIGSKTLSQSDPKVFPPKKETADRGPVITAGKPPGNFSFRALLQNAFSKSGHKNGLVQNMQNVIVGEPETLDFEELEAIRARRLLKYHLLDPFDAAARLQRLYQDATRLPAGLYREGWVATAVHVVLWVLLTVTVWRVSIARDAVRDSERSFHELYASQATGENDHLNDLLSHQPDSDASHALRDRKHRIVISDRQSHHPHFAAPVASNRRHQVAPSSRTSIGGDETSTLPADAILGQNADFIMLSQQELKHLVVLLELKRLISDIFRVWPTENGNIGLNGFWSSLWFTGIALGSPFLLIYAVFPTVLYIDVAYVGYLSYVACLYGTLWILAAYVSIRGVTKKIPAFREVRRVERINLTEFPYSIRNYMAIGSVIWDGFQLNTTSFSVWKMSYKPKQIAALTTIDLQDVGLGSLQINVFESKQAMSLVCLLLWFFCLKASNKFKSMQFLNYLLTFLLPNLLGGMLFMFLSKQFYQTAACHHDTEQNATVMWSNSDIRCWTDDAHKTYALRGMFGMSIFVPLAVLAYGSYQVFFPEVNLDVQTSPMLNVSAQIVKAAMMGALTFFVDQVQLFLAVALVGNLLLLFLVVKYDLCSTWHLRFGKVLIYAMSSWSALCAMISTFVRDGEDKDRMPLYTMHIGWGVLCVVAIVLTRRRIRKQKQKQLVQDVKTPGRHVLIKQHKHTTSVWNRKPPSLVTPTGDTKDRTLLSSTPPSPLVSQVTVRCETNVTPQNAASKSPSPI